MIVNFDLKDNIALSYNSRHIDLHNNFDFTGYHYNIAERQLILTWTRSFGEWVREDEFEKLTIIHFNVFFLNIGYDNKLLEFPEDDKCLGEISFFPSSYREINNEIIDQNKPKDGDDILYIFQTEHFIRVGCDNVELIAG